MKNKKKYLYPVIEMVLLVVVTICIFRYVVIPVRIDGISMENTLHDDTVALINAIGVKKENIKRFDIVVVNSEELNEKIIKRVIGLPGETVEFKDDVLYIDGVEVKQTFLDEEFVEESKTIYNTKLFTEDFKVTVGEGEYFVMGDNRDNSTDSRIIGLVPAYEIEGTTNFAIFPFDRFGNFNE